MSDTSEPRSHDGTGDTTGIASETDATQSAPFNPGSSSAGSDFQPVLQPEDQEKVNGFLERGVNSVERRPFRPLVLVVILIVVVGTLSLLSQWLATSAGVY